MITCPVCKKKYKPDLIRKQPEMRIQDEFPCSKPISREQLISGICSDSCWEQATDLIDPQDEGFPQDYDYYN